MTDNLNKDDPLALLARAHEEIDHSYDHAMDPEADDDRFESFTDSVIGRLRRIRRLALSKKNHQIRKANINQ